MWVLAVKFFFEVDADQRSLYVLSLSFPTRSSSDLRPPGRARTPGCYPGSPRPRRSAVACAAGHGEAAAHRHHRLQAGPGRGTAPRSPTQARPALPEQTEPEQSEPEQADSAAAPCRADEIGRAHV